MIKLSPSAAFSLKMGVTGLLLLAFALVSQHGFGYEPCTMCIEIRFWLALAVIMSFLATLATLFSKKLNWLLNLSAVCMYGAATFWAAKLVMLERGIAQAAGCTPFPFYNQHLPLGDWFPSIFGVQGLCGQPAMIFNFLSYSELSVIGLTITMSWLMLCKNGGLKCITRP